MERGADKRTAAYADIFGRPSPNHHQYPRPPPSTSTYAQYQQQTEYGAQSYYYQQQYDPRYDAYAQAAQQQYAQQAYAPSAYRQQPYYSAQYAQQYQQLLLSRPFCLNSPFFPKEFHTVSGSTPSPHTRSPRARV